MDKISKSPLFSTFSATAVFTAILLVGLFGVNSKVYAALCEETPPLRCFPFTCGSDESGREYEQDTSGTVICSSASDVCCKPKPICPGLCYNTCEGKGDTTMNPNYSCINDASSPNVCCIPNTHPPSCPNPPDGYCLTMCNGDLAPDYRYGCDNSSDTCCRDSDIVPPPPPPTAISCTPNSIDCPSPLIVSGHIIRTNCPFGVAGCPSNQSCIAVQPDVFKCLGDREGSEYLPDPAKPWFTGKRDIKVEELIQLVYKVLLPVSIGFGLYNMIRAGYTIKTSEGNPQKKQQGFEDLSAAIIGIIFVGVALTLLRIILTSVIGIG